MKNKENVKNTFSNIRPSDECIERITEMTKDKSKKRVKIVPALALVACMAIVVSGVLGSGIIPAKINSVDIGNKTTQAAPSANNFFTITAYAEENGEKKSTELNEHKLILQDYKLRKFYDTDGFFAISGSGDSAFEITGENIKSVRYTCEKGDFGYVIDLGKKNYLIEQNEYYEAIIPYSSDLENYSGASLTKVVFENYENGKYDEYFNSKRAVEDFINVDLVYDENENIIGVGFLTKEMYNSISSGPECKDFTFTKNLKTEFFNSVYWHPDISVLITENGKDNGKSFEDIEHDTLTITVTFEDNSVQKASYDLGFNKDGNLVIQKLK